MLKLLIATSIFVALSATCAMAESTGGKRPQEWPYGLYDKLHRAPPVIREGSRGKIIIYRGSRREAVRPDIIVIPPPKDDRPQ